MTLADKTLIVTGASNGIGAAAARLLAAEGANLVLTGRDQDRLAATAAEAQALGGQARTLAADIAHPETADRLVDLAQTAFGGLDGAFNNAGMTGDAAAVTEMDDAAWMRVIDVNLTSAFRAARAQIPALRARGGGALVFTSSFVGHATGLPGMAAYAAAKAGLVGLTRVLAAEHGAENIRVNALLPGGTRTAMAGDDAGFHDWVAGLHALKRMAEPEEIARAALFLLSPQASFVTGTAFFADGGNSVTKT